MAEVPPLSSVEERRRNMGRGGERERIIHSEEVIDIRDVTIVIGLSQPLIQLSSHLSHEMCLRGVQLSDGLCLPPQMLWNKRGNWSFSVFVIQPSRAEAVARNAVTDSRQIDTQGSRPRVTPPVITY